MRHLAEYLLCLAVGAGIIILALAAMLEPDPISERISRDASQAAAVLDDAEALNDFRLCMAHQLRQYEPTDAEYAAAQTFCEVTQ